VAEKATTGNPSKTSENEPKMDAEVKMRHGFEFLQFNMHHCKSSALNLRRTFDMGCTDIALIQEPFVYLNRVQDLNSKLGSILVGTRSMKPPTCMLVSNRRVRAMLVFISRDMIFWVYCGFE
jgi:hypothetical protein